MTVAWRSMVLMVGSIPILIYGLKCLVNSAYMQGAVLVIAALSMGQLGGLLSSERMEKSGDEFDRHADD